MTEEKGKLNIPSYGKSTLKFKRQFKQNINQELRDQTANVKKHETQAYYLCSLKKRKIANHISIKNLK